MESKILLFGNENDKSTLKIKTKQQKRVKLQSKYYSLKSYGVSLRAKVLFKRIQYLSSIHAQQKPFIEIEKLFTPKTNEKFNNDIYRFKLFFLFDRNPAKPLAETISSTLTLYGGNLSKEEKVSTRNFFVKDLLDKNEDHSNLDLKNYLRKTLINLTKEYKLIPKSGAENCKIGLSFVCPLKKVHVKLFKLIHLSSFLRENDLKYIKINNKLIDLITFERIVVVQEEINQEVEKMMRFIRLVDTDSTGLLKVFDAKDVV
eukprot:snap_masked-scaffold_7-processed-gene-6.23-mRNA-1 protein AED:1.00 eAED:1.00 QI:0/-1/0/0/-1/1/1/0/258